MTPNIYDSILIELYTQLLRYLTVSIISSGTDPVTCLLEQTLSAQETSLIIPHTSRLGTGTLEYKQDLCVKKPFYRGRKTHLFYLINAQI